MIRFIAIACFLALLVQSAAATAQTDTAEPAFPPDTSLEDSGNGLINELAPSLTDKDKAERLSAIMTIAESSASARHVWLRAIV